MGTLQESGPEAPGFDLPGLCRAIAESSPQPMVAVEGPGHVVGYVNPAFSRLTGKPAAELLGHPFADAVPEAGRDDCLAVLNRVYRTGLPEHLTEQQHQQNPPTYWTYYLWAIRGRDERPAAVMIQVVEATEAAVFRLRSLAMVEALFLSSVRQHELIDTNRQRAEDRRELDEQVYQSRKLESLGVLAGGIAHDLNNILTPVLGYAELASSSLPEDSPAVAMLREVSKNAMLAADLIQQILAYAGKGHFVLLPIDLTELIRDIEGLLRALVPVDIELRYELVKSLPPVLADGTQLRQVVINLVKNAVEAISGSGTVVVRTGKLEASRPEAQPEADVYLEVSDTGCGMKSEFVEKIFDPFFTTKFTGRGLGLAVVQGIARGHRGLLRVQSEPGKGSTFRILLPRTLGIAAVSIDQRPAVGWQGSGTVLVIDDDRCIRDLISMMLKEAGFDVLVAVDGVEGVAAFMAHADEIDAVFLDLTMPRMNGLEAASVLQEARAGIPIVLMSGYSVTEITHQARELDIAGFIQKPFTRSEFLAMVRQTLRR